MKKIALAFILFLGLGTAAIAETETKEFNLTVDKTKVAMGDAIYLNLVFEGTQDIPKLTIEDLGAFSIRYVGPSSRMTVTNGKSAVSITHVYVLVPLKVGTFPIGPFSFEYKGVTYTSKQLTIEVVSGTVEGGASEDEDLEDKIFLIMEVDKDEVYLNEIFPVKIKLYIRDVRPQNIQYPVIDHEGFSLSQIVDLPQYRDILGEKYFDVIEFKTKSFATKTGELMLGPAVVNCDILVRRNKQRKGSPFAFDDFDSFFGDFLGAVERYPLSLKAPQVFVTVLPLPEENKPEQFNGAVGNFSFDAEASPKELNVGDPVTLKLIVSGEGNFDTVRFPALSFPLEDFKVYEPQIISKENIKIFEYVVIPTKQEITAIPKIELSFFDPQSGEYKKVSKGPLKITVKERPEEEIKIVAVPDAREEQAIKVQKLGRDIIYIKDSLGVVKKQDTYFYKNRWFVILQFLPFICFLITTKIYNHLHKLKVDQAYARRLRAPKVAQKGIKEAQKFLKEDNPPEFYDTIFKTLQKYLGYKLHMPWRGITADIVKALKEKGIEDDSLEKIKTIISECDLARYAPLEFDIRKMRESLSQLREIIDSVERRLR
jgi:hypothetical protein